MNEKITLQKNAEELALLAAAAKDSRRQKHLPLLLPPLKTGSLLSSFPSVPPSESTAAERLAQQPTTRAVENNPLQQSSSTEPRRRGGQGGKRTAPGSDAEDEVIDGGASLEKGELHLDACYTTQLISAASQSVELGIAKPAVKATSSAARTAGSTVKLDVSGAITFLCTRRERRRSSAAKGRSRGRLDRRDV